MVVLFTVYLVIFEGIKNIYKYKLPSSLDFYPNPWCTVG